MTSSNSGNLPFDVSDGTGTAEILRMDSSGSLTVRSDHIDTDMQIRLNEGITLKVETIDGEQEFEVAEMVTEDGRAIGYWLESGIHREWLKQEELETMYQTGQLTVVQENKIQFKNNSSITINTNQI